MIRNNSKKGGCESNKEMPNAWGTTKHFNTLSSPARTTALSKTQNQFPSFSVGPFRWTNTRIQSLRGKLCPPHCTDFLEKSPKAVFLCIYILFFFKKK